MVSLLYTQCLIIIYTVVTRYTQDGFKWYSNSSHPCLGMIFDLELVREKHCRVTTIKKACLALAKNKTPLSPLS